jgi:CRP-like cAMP-binding protein
VASADRNLAIRSKLQIRLFDLDPDFVRSVPADEREQARAVRLPAIELPQGDFDPAELLVPLGGWYGVLIDGMVNRVARIGDHLALRVLGPAAIVPAFDVEASEVFATSQWSMAAEGRMAVLGEEFLMAARRWPELYINLLTRIAEQSEQLVTQLTLCQLPRVEDRLLAMLWLLTDSWGKVTPAGTVLPLHFTHEALGAMVGARRSTVTLALVKLAERGAVVQRDGGWLLLAPPPQQLEERQPAEPPRLLDMSPTSWAAQEHPRADPSIERDELFALLSRLREDHRRSIVELRERVNRAQAVRDRTAEIRAQLNRERAHRRARVPPPT